MTLVKWSPFRGLQGIDRDMDEFFQGFATQWQPAADIIDKKDGYEIKVELPGVSKEDVKVDLNDDVLTITGEKKYEKSGEDESRYVCERSYGSFTRRFTLPGTINRDKVEATYKDGVLHLSLPKAETAKPKQIEIR